MTVADFIAAVVLKATGSVSTLTDTDDDWAKILQLGNYYQQTWAKQPGVDWQSLYEPAVSCGTVTATDTFPLDSSIAKISLNQDDPIRVIHSDGNTYTDYTLVPSDQLKLYVNDQAVTRIGSQLKFAVPFTTSSAEYGGTIYVPGYTLPTTLVNDTDVISTDDPYWLVTICAAEYVRNDLVRQNQYPSLVTEANQLMQKMQENNGSQFNQVTKTKVGYARNW